MSTSYLSASGHPVVLTRTIASAAEGLVAEVADRPAQVVKIMHGIGSKVGQETVNTDPEGRMRKVAVMIANPPEVRAQLDGHLVLAWPQELVFENGQPVGYLMPLVDLNSTVPLRTLLATGPASRDATRPPAWVASFPAASRTYTGINLSRAVAAAHGTGAVIGDFNDSNVLVSSDALVTIVDCDSMQFRDPAGTVYLCDVGHTEYLPPELLGRTLAGITRDRESDYYSLAVHLYRLLLGGVHPFAGGLWTGAGARPTTRSLVKLGQYVGGPGSPLAPAPRDPDFATLPTELRTLFDRAFRFGARRPHDRPRPREWIRSLEKTLPART